jgi:hypothetical protein
MEKTKLEPCYAKFRSDPMLYLYRMTLGSIMGGDIVIVEGSRTGMRNSAVDIPTKSGWMTT